MTCFLSPKVFCENSNVRVLRADVVHQGEGGEKLNLRHEDDRHRGRRLSHAGGIRGLDKHELSQSRVLRTQASTLHSRIGRDRHHSAVQSKYLPVSRAGGPWPATRCCFSLQSTNLMN